MDYNKSRVRLKQNMSILSVHQAPRNNLLVNYSSETSEYSRPQIITTPFARCVTGLVHNY